MIQYKSLDTKEEKEQILADFELYVATETKPKMIFREFFEITEFCLNKGLDLRWQLMNITRKKFSIIRGV